MGETISTSNKCQTASLLNPVIAQESSVGIEEAKDKKQLQGEIEETTSAKEIFTGDREVCSKERNNAMEENSKSSPDATNRFKGSIVEIPKNNDGNSAVKTIEQEKGLKAVKISSSIQRMKVRLDQRDRFLGFHKKRIIHLPSLRSQKQRQTRQTLTIQNKNKSKSIKKN